MKYPARFSNYVHSPEKVQEYVSETKGNINTLDNHDTFIRRYVLDDVPLAFIHIKGVSEATLSEWAADELKSYKNWEKKFNFNLVSDMA